VEEDDEEDAVDSPTQSDQELSDDSEVESLCSSDGASEVSEPDSPTQSDRGLSDDDSEAGERAPRAEAGAFTLYSNGYFTITQNPKFTDVKIIAAKRFCTPEGLGEKLMSKTIRPKKNGETMDSYPRTLACLHAWMLDRAHANGFDEARACRRRLFAKEREALRKMITDLSSESGRRGTGHPHSDKLIGEWAPDVLVPDV
jgi:hypothetical protein